MAQTGRVLRHGAEVKYRRVLSWSYRLTGTIYAPRILLQGQRVELTGGVAFKSITSLGDTWRRVSENARRAKLLNCRKCDNITVFNVFVFVIITLCCYQNAQSLLLGHFPACFGACSGSGGPAATRPDNPMKRCWLRRIMVKIIWCLLCLPVAVIRRQAKPVCTRQVSWKCTEILTCWTVGLEENVLL